jgi:trimethylamine--corrinoid protein Co-methyltransferase
VTSVPPASDRRARRGSGGAEARRAARSGGHPTQLTYIKRNIPLYEVLSEEGLELIEGNCETVLEEIGIDFRDDTEALEMCRRPGRPRTVPQGPCPFTD